MSKIETLPEEVLERIFVDSANGNLLLAAPRIAVRLSRNESIYRVAFALAFYNHQLYDFLAALGISRLIPSVDLPMNSWDVRSMTKAVLRSRWCTCGWTLDLFISLERNELTRIVGSLPKTKRKFLLDLIAAKLPKSDGSLGVCHWEGPSDVFNLLGNSPERYGNYLGALSQEVEIRSFKAMFMQCVPLTVASKSRFSTKFSECSRAASFRSFIEAFLREEGTRWDPRGDLWPTVECIAQRSILDLEDLNFEEDMSKEWLRYMIAVDYFFHPEDHPFKISPSAFRHAAILDAMDYDVRLDSVLDYQIPCVLHLFEIDPLATPREDPVLLQWARLHDAFIHSFKSLYNASRHELAALEMEIEEAEDDYEAEDLSAEHEKLEEAQSRASAIHAMMQHFQKYLLPGTVDFLPDYNSVSIFLMHGSSMARKFRAVDCNPISPQDISSDGASEIEDIYAEGEPTNEVYSMLGVEGPHGWDYSDYEYNPLEVTPRGLFPYGLDLDTLIPQHSPDTDFELVDDDPPAWFQPTSTSYMRALSSI